MSNDSLSNTDKAFIQCLLAQRLVPVEAAEALLVACSRLQGAPATPIQEVVARAKKSLDPFKLDVQLMSCDNTLKDYYGLVNMTADEATKFGTTYKEKDIAFFKALINKMLSTQQLSSIDALNVANGIANYSKADAQEMMAQLVKDWWLFRTPDGEYRLGVRVSFELSEYLEETYGRDKVPGCNLCSYTVLQGVRCPEKRCSVQLHFHCARDWFGSKNVTRCTVCSIPWTLPPTVQRAVNEIRNQRGAMLVLEDDA